MKNYLNKIKLNKAFTVIELIVIMAVIALLVFLGTLAYNGYTKQARFTALQYDSRLISDACQQYYISNGDYPRKSDIPYTASQVNEFSSKVYNQQGKVITLDSSGNYYDIDLDKLKKYIKINDDASNFILQNPVGDVYILDSATNVRLGENAAKIPAAPVVTINADTNPPVYSVTYPGSVTPQLTEYQLDNGTITSTAPTGVVPGGDHTFKVRYKYNNFYSAWVSTNFTIPTGKGRYVIFDVYGIQSGGSPSVALTEIKIYDKNNNLINYTPTAAYDSALKGIPYYWSDTYWNRSNLNDNDTRYTDNSSGAFSSTGFFHNGIYGVGTTNTWARFALDLGSTQNIGRIEIWAGSPEKRIPQYVEAFVSDNYDYSELNTRTNTNMKSLGKVTFSISNTTVSQFNIAVP